MMAGSTRFLIRFKTNVEEYYPPHFKVIGTMSRSFESKTEAENYLESVRIRDLEFSNGRLNYMLREECWIEEKRI